MRLLRPLAPAAALVFAAASIAQTTPPPAGPTTGGTCPPPKAPGAGGKTPAPKAPGAGGTAPTGPKLIFPGDIGRDRPTSPGTRFPVSLFRTQDVARSLSLTEAQVNELNASTEQLQTRFREQFDRLATLSDRERAERLLQLNREYNAAWLAEARDVFNARQLARYRQLQLQFGGLSSLTDPEVQRQLALTEAQIGRLPDSLNWRDVQMQAILRQAELDRARGLQLFNDFNQAQLDRLNQFLTAEQLRQWQQLTGDPFQFPPPVPTAPGGPGGPTTGGAVPPGGPTTGGPVPPKK